MNIEVGKVIGIVFVIVILLFVSGSLIYLSLQHPERRLDVGADIKSVDIQDNYAHIVLSGGSNDKKIEEIKFIFTDIHGVEHYYSTTEGIANLSTPYNKSLLNLFKKQEFNGEYEYVIDSNYIGLKDFTKIYKVDVMFEYEKEKLDIKKDVSLDTKVIHEENNPSGGGGSSFIPDSDLIPLPKAYWRHNNQKVTQLNDFVYGDFLTLILENSGLSAGTNVEFTVYEKDFFSDDYMTKLNVNTGDSFASVVWHINETQVQNARNLFEGNKLELYFVANGVKSDILHISFHVEVPVVQPNCSDGIKNQDETGVDCGGVICNACSIPANYLRTFYISSSLGNDSWSGRAPAWNGTDGPWQTISKVNGESFEPGDAILFKRGDTWRETLEVPSSGNSTDYITFRAYGIGDKPKILGSEQITGWIDQGGNIWKSENTFVTLPNSADIVFKKLDKSELFGTYNSTTSLLTIEYDYTYSSNYIYVYSTTNPTTAYAGIEVAQRPFCVSTNDNEYLHFDGIDVFYCAIAGYDSNNDHEISDVHGFIIENSEIGFIGGKRGDTGFGIATIYSDLIIKNNKIHDCGRRGVAIDAYGYGFTVENTLVENNTFYNGYHTTGIDLDVCAFGNKRYTISWNNVTIRNNLFYESPTRSAADGSNLIFIQNNYPSVCDLTNIYIYNNIFKYPNGGAIMTEGIEGPVYIYNNVFYEHNPSLPAWMAFVLPQALGGQNTNSVTKNNIFYGGESGTFSAMEVWGSWNVHDYNLYYNAGTYTETNKVTGNPLFVDATHNDFHLQAGSPAIDAGAIIPGIHCATNGSHPDDGCVEWYNSAPDIGVFEFIGY